MTTATKFISPFDAMWREIGCLYRALEQARVDLEAAVAGLGAEIHGRPVAKGPSIAALLLQCGSEEASWIHRKWSQAELPGAWRPFLETGANQSLDAVLGWLRDVREATRLRLMKASDADLDRQTIQADGGPASLRWVLHRLLDQSAFARGQIALLRAMGGPTAHAR
jgi:hypothetical protein